MSSNILILHDDAFEAFLEDVLSTNALSPSSADLLSKKNNVIFKNNP